MDSPRTEPASVARDVLVKHPHDDLSDDTYHEWVTLGERLLLDALGRPNPRRRGPANWTVWICNNTTCAGRVLVCDAAIRRLVTEAADDR